MVLFLVTKWHRNFRGKDIWTSINFWAFTWPDTSRLLNYTSLYIRRAKVYRGRRCRAPLIRNHGSISRWMFNCTSRLLYLWRKTAGTVWQGPTVGMDVSEKTEICWNKQEWKPGPPNPYTIYCNDWAVDNNVNKTVISLIRIAVTVFVIRAGKYVQVSMKLCCLYVLWVEAGGWGASYIWRR